MSVVCREGLFAGAQSWRGTNRDQSLQIHHCMKMRPLFQPTSICNTGAQSNTCTYSVWPVRRDMEHFTINDIWPSFSRNWAMSWNCLNFARVLPSSLCYNGAGFLLHLFPLLVYKEFAVLHRKCFIACTVSFLHTDTEPLTGKERKGKPSSLSKHCLEQPNQPKLTESRTCSPLRSVTLHVHLAFSQVKTRQDPGYQQLGFLTHWWTRHPHGSILYRDKNTMGERQLLPQEPPPAPSTPVPPTVPSSHAYHPFTTVLTQYRFLKQEGCRTSSLFKRVS